MSYNLSTKGTLPVKVSGVVLFTGKLSIKTISSISIHSFGRDKTGFRNLTTWKDRFSSRPAQVTMAAIKKNWTLVADLWVFDSSQLLAYLEIVSNAKMLNKAFILPLGKKNISVCINLAMIKKLNRRALKLINDSNLIVTCKIAT